MKDREDLADYIRRTRRAAHLSCKDIATRARLKGFPISTSYVTRLENREINRPSLNKLTALAHGLEVTSEEINAVYRGESIEAPRTQETAILNMIRALPAPVRDDVIEIIRLYYRRHGAPKKKSDR